MSSPEDLRLEAETLLADQHYLEAADAYCDLIDATFKEDSDISIQMCVDFVHYVECLINAYEEDAVAENLETAWEILENAKMGYETMNHCNDFDEEIQEIDDFFHKIIGYDKKFEDKLNE